MINLPYEKIIANIKENSDLSEEDITARIDKKLKQLSGLISKEGAAHILANELGIKLFEVSKKNLKIKDVLEGMRGIELAGKVQRIYEVREFTSQRGPGKVASFIIADETGSIRIVCWHDQTEIIPQLVENMTVKIVGGYVRANNGRKEIHLNQRSKVVFNPKNVEIGKVKKFSADRKKLSEISEQDQNIEILATVVQVFDPRFFEVCPECGKRARPRDDSHFCEEHGKVKPTYSYVLNLLLDDGTATTRTIFFGSRMDHLLGKTKEEILKYRENPDEFEPIKTDMLGKTIKVIGRVRRNEMFDRLEITANLVFPNIDPKEEIKRLEEEEGQEEKEEKEENETPKEDKEESTEPKESNNEQAQSGEEQEKQEDKETPKEDSDKIQEIAFNKNS